MADAVVSFFLESLKARVESELRKVEARRDEARADEARSNHIRKNASSVIIDVHQYGQEIQARNQVQRVPGVFRDRHTQSKLYDPLIVSIGPYHHNITGNADLSHTQVFKEDYSLKAFLSEGHYSKEKTYFKEKLLERIKDIKMCYDKESMSNFEDNDLVELILLDACFLIYYMELTTSSSTRRTKLSVFYSYFGPARIKLIFRDLILLENQLPFWIMEFLLCLQSDEGQSIWHNLLGKFMNVVFYGKSEGKTTLPWADKNIEPFHFLEAYYETLKVDIPIGPSSSTSGISIGERNPDKSNSYRFRSITNLRVKGVQFNLSKSKGPEVISFTSSYFWGNLNLPALFFSTNFFVIYSNLIAYEMFPTSPTDFFVSSLVNLLKSLIESPEDVKILREKGILFNDMVTDGDVAKIIQDLDTFGLENIGTFLELRDCIEKHCSKKRYTWIAEIIHNNLKNPWNAIALLSAMVLLGLTIVQAYYAIHPKKN